MPKLPESGQISASQINDQLGRFEGAEFSFGTAVAGGYGAINTNSPYRPNNVAPHYMSEWYSYAHNLRPLTLLYSGTYASYAMTDGYYQTIWIDAVSLVNTIRVYLNSSMDNLPQPPAGFYISGGNWYEVREGAGQFMEVVAFGVAARGTYPDGDPGNVYPDATLYNGYIFYNSWEYDVYIGTCSLNHSGTGRIYINYNDGKVYTSWNNLTNEFSGLFTGYIMRDTDCVALQYSSGDYIGVITG